MTAPPSDLAPVVGPRLELLRGLGFGELQHDSHVPFLSHLLGTRRVLASWGERPALCDAGLFHSAYGTEYFEPTCTENGDDVIAVIGAEAERIAWLWCAIRRDTIGCHAEHRTVRLRNGDAVELLTPAEVSTSRRCGPPTPSSRSRGSTRVRRRSRTASDRLSGAASEPARASQVTALAA